MSDFEPATCDACGGVLIVKKDPDEGRAWWTCSGCGSEFEMGLGPLRMLYPDLAARRAEWEEADGRRAAS